MTSGLSRQFAIGRAIAVRLVLLTPWVFAVSATEVVEWRNVPISILLHVGEERVLAFPDHVQVGVPPSLTANRFRTQSTGGTVLWLAQQPFESQRIQVRMFNTGHVMLFDVTAIEGASNSALEPVQVSFPDTVGGLSTTGRNAAAPALTPVALTRFAAQQLYAPQRLLANVPGIRRVPMGAPDSISLYRDDVVIANPLGSWQGGGIYVTAVKLTNAGPQRVLLDPRLLKGRFISATFQHNSLGPAASRSDTTCVYLVTDRPFMASTLSTNAVSRDHSGDKD